MGVLLWIVVIAIGILVGLLSLVALCPIHLELAVGTVPLRLKIKWLCFAFETDHAAKMHRISILGMTIIRSAITPKPEETEKQKERKTAKKEAKQAKKQRKRAKKRAKKRKTTFADYWRVIQDHPETIKKWLQQISWLIYRIVAAMRIDHFQVKAVVATSDPAWTGAIYGYAEAACGALRRIPRVTFDLRPDFQIDRPTAEISLAVTYRMYRLTWALLRFLWSVPKWDTIRIARRLTQSSQRR